MVVLLSLPAAVSILALGAHFLRSGQLLIVLLLLGALPLLALRRQWAVRTVQVVLVLGALEWVRTLVALARLRLALDQPYARMTLILGAVSLLTVLSALLLESRRLRQRQY